MEQEAAQNDSTVAWLLARLAQRQREEKEAKEAAELDQLEVRLREVDLELIREGKRVCGGSATRPTSSSSSSARSLGTLPRGPSLSGRTPAV